MIIPPNPSSPTANIDRLLEEIRDLRRVVEDLAGLQAVATIGRRGQITAYVGGSTTLTATLDTGGTAVCRWIPNNGYTPAVNHFGLVLVTPSANWWLGQDSIP